jgi:hypothetical protein
LGTAIFAGRQTISDQKMISKADCLVLSELRQ